MNDVKLFYTTQGLILGKLVAQSSIGVTLENPVIVVQQAQNVQFVPMLGLTSETSVTFAADKLFVTHGVTPLVDLLNQYNSIFGSGIQLATRMP